MLTHPSSPGAISFGYLVRRTVGLPFSLKGECSPVRRSAQTGSTDVREEAKQTLTTAAFNMVFSAAPSLILRLEQRQRDRTSNISNPTQHTDDSTSRPHFIHISKYHRYQPTVLTAQQPGVILKSIQRIPKSPCRY
jgi:hypothetical protein